LRCASATSMALVPFRSWRSRKIGMPLSLSAAQSRGDGHAVPEQIVS
jgi:hypothetical protein